MVAAGALCFAPRAAGKAGPNASGGARVFRGRGFVEVDTPALQVSPGLEPHLRAFSTELHDPGDGRTVRRYLHTSPEFAMKKLLAAGHAADLAARPCVSRRRAQRHPSSRIFDARMVSRRRARGATSIPDCVGLVRACQAAAHSPSSSGPGSTRPSTDRWNAGPNVNARKASSGGPTAPMPAAVARDQRRRSIPPVLPN